MQNTQMKLTVGGTFKTVCGLEAKLTYLQPKDVQDSFPFIGHVLSGTDKIGMCWSVDGRAGESTAYDLIQTERVIANES